MNIGAFQNGCQANLGAVQQGWLSRQDEGSGTNLLADYVPRDMSASRCKGAEKGWGVGASNGYLSDATFAHPRCMCSQL
jgi:hypothetical protein